MEVSKSATLHATDKNTNTNKEKSNSKKIDHRKKLPHPVYYVESTNDNTVLVGINVTINYNETNKESVSVIRWHDTCRERAMTASNMQQKDDTFAFKRIDQEGGGHYYFAPMNLKIYNEKVKQRLISGADFTNEDDLIKAFLSTARTSFN